MIYTLVIWKGRALKMNTFIAIVGFVFVGYVNGNKDIQKSLFFEDEEK